MTYIGEFMLNYRNIAINLISALFFYCVVELFVN